MSISPASAAGRRRAWGLGLAVGLGLVSCLPSAAPAGDRWKQGRMTPEGVIVIDREPRTDVRVRRNPSTGGYDLYDRHGTRIGYARPSPLTGDLELFGIDGQRGIQRPHR